MIRVTYDLQRREQKAAAALLGAPARVARQQQSKSSRARPVFAWMLFAGLSAFFFLLMRVSPTRSRQGVRIGQSADVSWRWGMYVAIAGFILFVVTLFAATFFNGMLIRRKLRGTTHTFTEDGVTQEHEGVRTFMRWSFFDSFGENEQIFILRYGREGLVLPKRLFAPADLDIVRELLTRKLVVPVPSLVGGFEVQPT